MEENQKTQKQQTLAVIEIVDDPEIDYDEKKPFEFLRMLAKELLATIGRQFLSSWNASASVAPP